jgi:hypothetical protein
MIEKLVEIALSCSAMYPEGVTLAVAGGDEVGDRGDAVRLADADDLEHQKPPQRGHQRGAQIDRQEADAARGGAPDAAVERP